MRLISSLLLSLIIIAATISIFRLYGLSQTHKTRQHPAFQASGDLKFSPNEKNWPLKDVAPYISLKLKDGKLVSPKKNLQELTKNIPKEETAILVEITEDAEKINFLLNQWVEKNDLGEKVIIASRYKNILENLRKARPRWLTTYSTNEIFLSLFLEKMFLASIAPIKADFIYLSPHILEKKWWHELPFEEFKRRKKGLLIRKGSEIHYHSSKPQNL